MKRIVKAVFFTVALSTSAFAASTVLTAVALIVVGL